MTIQNGTHKAYVKGRLIEFTNTSTGQVEIIKFHSKKDAELMLDIVFNRG